MAEKGHRASVKILLLEDTMIRWERTRFCKTITERKVTDTKYSKESQPTN